MDVTPFATTKVRVLLDTYLRPPENALLALNYSTPRPRQRHSCAASPAACRRLAVRSRLILRAVLRARHYLRHYVRLITLATQPPPKPLSMFTTLTFDAHLFSIVSSADIPPKLDPYPTLVGTAITGADTSPATPLGSAPSMPATQTITRALVSFSRCSSNRCSPAIPTS